MAEAGRRSVGKTILDRPALAFQSASAARDRRIIGQGAVCRAVAASGCLVRLRFCAHAKTCGHAAAMPLPADPPGGD